MLSLITHALRRLLAADPPLVGPEKDIFIIILSPVIDINKKCPISFNYNLSVEYN